MLKKIPFTELNVSRISFMASSQKYYPGSKILAKPMSFLTSPTGLSRLELSSNNLKGLNELKPIFLKNPT